MLPGSCVVLVLVLVLVVEMGMGGEVGGDIRGGVEIFASARNAALLVEHESGHEVFAALPADRADRTRPGRGLGPGHRIGGVTTITQGRHTPRPRHSYGSGTITSDTAFPDGIFQTVQRRQPRTHVGDLE